MSAPHSAAVAAADPVAALRAATHDIHQRLDSSLPLASPEACLPDYVLHLQAIAWWLDALSPVWACPGVPVEWAGVHAGRLARARSDLQDAGAGLPPATAQDHAAADALRTAAAGASGGYAWGLAYVVEGSQLGGAMLHRRLQARLAPHPLRYLQGDEAVGVRWKSFMADLRAAIVTPAETDAAVRGAVAGFQALVDRFERVQALA